MDTCREITFHNALDAGKPWALNRLKIKKNKDRRVKHEKRFRYKSDFMILQSKRRLVYTDNGLKPIKADYYEMVDHIHGNH